MDNRNERLRSFYIWFKGSRLYHGTIILIIFICTFLFPIYGDTINPIFTNDIIVYIGMPILALMLMFIVFALYVNPILYIGILLYSAIINFWVLTGMIMGSITDRDMKNTIIFASALAVFLAINVFIGFYTYKYKREVYMVNRN